MELMISKDEAPIVVGCNGSEIPYFGTESGTSCFLQQSLFYGVRCLQSKEIDRVYSDTCLFSFSFLISRLLHLECESRTTRRVFQNHRYFILLLS